MQFSPAMLEGAMIAQLRFRLLDSIPGQPATTSWAIYNFANYAAVPAQWIQTRNYYYKQFSWQIWDTGYIEAGPMSRKDLLSH